MRVAIASTGCVVDESRQRQRTIPLWRFRAFLDSSCSNNLRSASANSGGKRKCLKQVLSNKRAIKRHRSRPVSSNRNPSHIDSVRRFVLGNGGHNSSTNANRNRYVIGQNALYMWAFHYNNSERRTRLITRYEYVKEKTHSAFMHLFRCTYDGLLRARNYGPKMKEKNEWFCLKKSYWELWPRFTRIELRIGSGADKETLNTLTWLMIFLYRACIHNVPSKEV